MNRKEVFWYTGKLVWRKDAVIICLFWSMVFFCLNGLIVCGKSMNEQKKTAVTILCEISQEYQDQLGVLRNMEGVQAVTVWEESTQLLEWNGYEAEVTLAGTDPEYLQKQFPEAYSQGKHSSMAWAIVDESMIKQLKDTKKHVIQGYVPEDLLYQTVEINGSGESREGEETSGAKSLAGRSLLCGCDACGGTALSEPVSERGGGGADGKPARCSDQRSTEGCRRAASFPDSDG